MAEKHECTIRDGRFLEPCDTMNKMTEFASPLSSKRGLILYQYTNMTTRQPSRSFVALRGGEYPKGLALNFCPWCGTRIDAPHSDPTPADHGGEA